MRTLVFLIYLLLKPLVHGDVFDFEQPAPSHIPMSLHHKDTGTYGLVNQGKQPTLNSLAKNYGGSESNAFFKPMMSKDTLNNQIGGSQLGSISEHQTFNSSDFSNFKGKGTQLTSKNLYSKNGVRIDVENPKPSQRIGQIHIQDNKGVKFYYDSEKKVFYNKDTGELAANGTQKLLKEPEVIRAIQKGEKILGLL